MDLRPFDALQLPRLMSWFPDAASCGAWGGPHFRFPYDAVSFREDARIDVLPTFVLAGAGGALLAFGQYYDRIGRCHLAHLAVAPEARGRGVGTQLIRQLCVKGASELGTRGFSLFVLRRNDAATRLYRRLGFSEIDYPQRLPDGEPMRYMIAQALADF
jgi:ribosomal protein S18 acetylase RimI-like enzyme